MRSQKIFVILSILCFIGSLRTYAQFTINGKSIIYDKLSNTYMASIPEDSFEKDYSAIIKIDADSAWSQLEIEGQKVEDNYIFQKIESNKEFSIKALRANQPVEAKITFTFLPLLELQGDFGYDFTQGSLSLLVPDGAAPITSCLKAKWRGGSTNSEGKHKRNYKLKILNENGKSRDISFLGMREDNNWILDAGQVDLFRLRNRIATELWNDFATKPYYTNLEPKAKSGVSGKVVELILNNEYRGIYSLTEAIDRKEMKLKKYDDEKQDFHGQLWKVSSWEKAQFWSIDKDYDNTQETWYGIETKYPDIDDVNPTDYSALYNAIDFVANSDEQTFKTQVAQYFDLPVVMDYQLFLEVTQAIDNRGKNIYWAIYDKTKDKKLTLAIWDLDATMGQNYECGVPLHPETVAPETDMNIKHYHNLYARLYDYNVDHYTEQVIDRYWNLRQSYFSEEALVNRYQKYYHILSASGAAQREELRWSKDSDIGGYPLNFKEEMNYITDWIHQRLHYLDTRLYPPTTSIRSTAIDHNKSKRPMYNLQGQRVNSSYKGLTIRNGKKYFCYK